MEIEAAFWLKIMWESIYSWLITYPHEYFQKVSRCSDILYFDKKWNSENAVIKTDPGLINYWINCDLS